MREKGEGEKICYNMKRVIEGKNCKYMRLCKKIKYIYIIDLKEESALYYKSELQY